MQPLSGLLFAVCFFAVGVCLKAKFSFSDTAFGSVLAWAFFGGTIIGFFDRIKSLRVFGGGFELAEKRVNQAADKAIADIKSEVDRINEVLPMIVDVSGSQIEILGEITEKLAVARAENKIGE